MTRKLHPGRPTVSGRNAIGTASYYAEVRVQEHVYSRPYSYRPRNAACRREKEKEPEGINETSGIESDLETESRSPCGGRSEVR
jgi:hypothetical protein